MLDLSPAVKLWYCPAPVDMRLGFDGLYARVVNHLNADPLSGHLFLFHNKRADRLEVLFWSGHALCLFCQRREQGRYHFPQPDHGQGVLELTAAQFLMVLDGFDLTNAKRFERFSPGAA